MRVRATLAFILEMVLFFGLFLLCGRLPAIVKMDWSYMISGDPAWRWVINIIVATVVALIVNQISHRLRAHGVLAVIAFLIVLTFFEAFAWHSAETIEIIKGTKFFSAYVGVIWAAVSAVIAFIIHLSRYSFDDDGDEEG